jgi:hypothetical protein
MDCEMLEESYDEFIFENETGEDNNKQGNERRAIQRQLSTSTITEA